ncbi:hypothetical protein C4580_06350 [Candidatus Woesearchaeota archaeon]|nr:MAG: hypothetical protein C4580_06350 [Candidatus Woesearchaeota archaeon]
MGLGKIIGIAAILFAVILALAIWLFPWWVWVILIVLAVVFVAACFLFPPLGAAVVGLFGTAAELGTAAATTAARAGMMSRIFGGGAAPAAGGAPRPPRAFPWKIIVILLIITALVLGLWQGFAAWGRGLLVPLVIFAGAIIAGLILVKSPNVAGSIIAVIVILALEFGMLFFTSRLPFAALLTIFIVIMTILISFSIKPHHTGTGPRPGSTVGMLVLIANLAFFLLILGTDVHKGLVSPTSPVGKTIDSLRTTLLDAPTKFIAGIQAIISGTKAGIERQILIGTGDYETGVEAASTKQLGVFLDNVALTDTDVGPDGVIDMYGRLRVESFKTQIDGEPLLITLSCYEQTRNITGEIRPSAEYEVEEYENFDIDCLFKANDLGKGSHTLALDAQFDFTTSAYIKSYFMDQETVRALRRQQQEPLAAFDITDTSPTAVYTGGPMRIGMNTGQQPISIIPDRKDLAPTLALTLERNWLDGELVALKTIRITVPPGLGIKSISGRDISGNTCTATSTQERTCTLSGDFLRGIFSEQDLKRPFTTLRIATEILDHTRLLGGAPLAIRSFKTEIDYTFRIKKTQTVTVTA